MTGEPQELGAFLIDQQRRLEAISDLMPYTQTLLFDWRGDLEASDGTLVGRFVNAWTRRDILVSADGRGLAWHDGQIVADAAAFAVDLLAALPSQRDWLSLGGYDPGDLLGESVAPWDLAS